MAGLKYYVTVTACNAADLCTSVSTDGVLVDDSPPLPGRVHHGAASDGPETGYQSSRSVLGLGAELCKRVVKWTGVPPQKMQICET